MTRTLKISITMATTVSSEYFRMTVYLWIAATFPMQRQQVCDTLEITLYGSGIEDQSLSYPLNAAEKKLLREKMEAYCMQREHKPLNRLCQEILQELDAPTQEMQM